MAWILVSWIFFSLFSFFFHQLKDRWIDHQLKDRWRQRGRVVRELDLKSGTPSSGVLPLCQRFRKFRLEFKWKGPFRFLPTRIFGITSGGGPLISVGIFRSKFAVPFLTNRFFALIREFGNDEQWQELFLLVGAV